MRAGGATYACPGVTPPIRLHASSSATWSGRRPLGDRRVVHSPTSSPDRASHPRRRWFEPPAPMARISQPDRDASGHRNRRRTVAQHLHHRTPPPRLRGSRPPRARAAGPKISPCGGWARVFARSTQRSSWAWKSSSGVNRQPGLEAHEAVASLERALRLGVGRLEDEPGDREGAAEGEQGSLGPPLGAIARSRSQTTVSGRAPSRRRQRLIAQSRSGASFEKMRRRRPARE